MHVPISFFFFFIISWWDESLNGSWGFYQHLTFISSSRDSFPFLSLMKGRNGGSYIHHVLYSIEPPVVSSLSLIWKGKGKREKKIKIVIVLKDIWSNFIFFYSFSPCLLASKQGESAAVSGLQGSVRADARHLCARSFPCNRLQA